MPVAITAVLSLLFKGRYDAPYATHLLTGLVLFFYFAECVRRAAEALKKRRLHPYGIPLFAVRRFMPSLIAIVLIRLTEAPFAPAVAVYGLLVLVASATLLWGLIWGVGQFISRAFANTPIFRAGINYGLNIFMLITPIFYPLTAIKTDFMQAVVGTNPLAVAIIMARAAFAGAAPTLPMHTAWVAALSACAFTIAGYAYAQAFNRRVL